MFPDIAKCSLWMEDGNCPELRIIILKQWQFFWGKAADSAGGASRN